MRSTLALGAVGLLLVAGLIPVATISAGTPPSAPGSNSSGPSEGRVAAGHSIPLSAFSTLGGDWPTYLGNSQRTAANLLERTLAPSNVSQLAVQWGLRMNGSEFASPTVTNGTAYVGSWDGYMYAVTVATGHILWKKNLGVSSTCYVGGTESSATVWNGTVYVGGGDDYWYALSALNGSVEWRIKVSDYGSASGNFDWASPLLSGGFEYIGLASCSDSPLVQGKLLKVDLRGNHSVVGEFDFAPNGKTGGTIWSTSAVDEATGTIWVATGNEGGPNQPYADAIVALLASNMSLIGSWQIPGLVGQDEDFGSGPTLFRDAAGRELVVANDKNGIAYALNRSNVTDDGSWAPVWEAPTGDVYAPLAFDGTYLYSGGTAATIQGHYYPSTLLALNPATGAVVWRAGLVGDTVYGAPVYANGLVVVGAGSDLEVVNATDGTLLGDVTLSTTGETIDGSPCVVGGRIFVGTGNFGSSGHLFELGIPLTVNGTSLPSNQTPDGWLEFEASPSGGASPYSFAWQFGDGGNGTGAAPVHAYASAGTYSVVVFVTDSTGTDSNATFQAVVARSPQPMMATVLASPPVGLAPFSATLRATVLVGGGAPYQLSWDFGDGSTAVGTSDWNESHLYPLIGPYLVHFEAIDRWGRSANTSADVLVVSPLLLTVTRAPSSGTAPLDVTLHAFVSGGSAPGPVFWQFGDGSSATSGSTVVHTFSAVGDFAVTAEVRDALGEDVWQNGTISVLAGSGGPAPLEATGSATLVGVDCTNNATVVNVIGDATGGTAPYTFSWDFGDRSPNTAGPSASHSYALVGSYVVTLNVTDAAGVSALNESSIAIDPWSCPTGSTPPTVSTPSTAGWATPTNLALLALGVGIAALVAFLVLRRYRR